MAQNPLYDRLANALKNAKTDVEILDITKSTFQGTLVYPSVIRADTLIKNSDEMKFVITDQATAQNTLNDSEVRLATQNIFIATHYGFFLKACSTTGHTKAVRHTFPNPAVFPNGTASLNADLEAIYQSGYLAWKTNGVEFLPRIELARHRKVPAFPKGQEITYSATGPHTGVIATTPSDPDDGWVRFPKKVLIDGGVPHEIRLLVPGGSGLAMKYDVSGTDFYAVLAYRGFEVQGVGK